MFTTLGELTSMNNSARVIRELKEVVENLKDKYGPDDVVAIAPRYSDRSVDKVECFFKDLVGRAFMIIDGKDPVCDEHKDAELVSLFVCNYGGKTLYDSVLYRQDAQKCALKKDGDMRLRAFKSLSEEDKEKTVNLIADAIEKSDINTESPAKDDTGWGDMPWDTK